VVLIRLLLLLSTTTGLVFVVRGVPEDRNSAIWHDVIFRVLHTAAGRDVQIDDAFRLGSFVQGRVRPLLVKMKSVWDRRLVLSGSRKLAGVPEFSHKIYIAAAESPEERRRSMMDRVKRILVRDGHDVYVDDGVLFPDGIVYVEAFLIIILMIVVKQV